jgi:GNAT superfamily N-acetyltransferase
MTSRLIGNLSRELVVRSARESDLDGIAEMIDGFAVGHPAADHSRSPSRLREAYFGPSPVAHLIVAARGDVPVGMAQWTRIYEMFWNVYGARVEWLYVRPQCRRTGIVTALVAEVCAQVRAAGGEFLYGGGGDDVEALYERVAIGGPTNECHLSAEAFQSFADLAGLPPRTIVRHLPAVELNRVAAVVRSSVPKA